MFRTAAVANAHGDVVTTVTVPSTGAASSIDGWNSCDEYGNSTPDSAATTGPIAYGWLGAKQRPTTTSGILLMGVGLYNPATGLFMSVDPVVGSNANAYTYPTDPLNSFDVDRRRWHWKRIKKWGAYKFVRGVYRHTTFSAGGCAVICYNVGFQGGTVNWTNPFRSRQYGWSTPGFSVGLSRLRAEHRGKGCTGGGASYAGIGVYGCGSKTRRGRAHDYEVGYAYRAWGAWGGRQENYTRRIRWLAW
jgi:RHS repeat-associated protein